MATADDFRALFAYNRAVLDDYRRGLARLPWRTVTRNVETGHLSMKNTYLHILRVYDAWVNYILPGRLAELAESRKRYDPDRLRSLAEVRAYDRSVWAGVTERLSTLTDRDLRRPVKAPWMPGTYTVKDALLQVTLEQAHHVGELIAVYWQMDREPPSMMWIPHLRRARRRPRRRPRGRRSR